MAVRRKLYLTVRGLCIIWAGAWGVVGLMLVERELRRWGHNWWWAADLPETWGWLAFSLTPLLALVLLNRWWRWLHAPD